MNWTEGALARHSRGKGWDKDAARQKQYFAKARARKHAPASSKGLDVTSFVPDYISQPQHSQERQSTNSTSSRKQRTPRRGLVYKQPEVANKSENNLPKDTSTRQGKGSAENEQTSNMHIDKDQQDLGIAEKRRRLLEKADWTGVITQKPALVDFSWRKEQSAKLPTKPVYDYRPGLTSRRSRQMDCPNVRTLGQVSSSEMKINIGNQNLRWSRDSNSVRSLSTRHDLMPYGYNNSNESQGIMSPYQQQAHSVDVSREPSAVLLRPREPRVNVEPRNPFLKFSAGNHNSRRRHIGCEENRPREPEEPRHIARANTPVIHQPQPKRGTRPRMFDIRSPDLQEDISTVGILGTSTKSSSRVTSEDIRWNTWLSSNAEPKLQQPAPTNQENQPSRSIRPGISQYWNTSEDITNTQSPASHDGSRQSLLPTMETPQPCSSASYPFSLPRPENHQGGTLNQEPELPQMQATHFPSVSGKGSTYSLPKSSGYGTNESSTKPGTDLVIPLRSQLPAIPNAPDLLDLLAAVEERHGVANDAPASREPTPDAEDEDEIWKKFVFDDDSIETSRKARQEAHEQTKRDLGLKKSNALLPFFESTLSSSSVAPPSDVAEPPSTLRNSSYLHKDSNHNETDDRAQDLREPSGAVQNKDIESTTDSVIAHPASPQPVHAEFKFHQPRLFVGRLANDAPCNPPSASLYDQPRKGRRPRKRREKERPDFRAIPNYNDDPIEED
ncbi:hypothetical protein ACHAP7_008556 [Fusarium lateritium]